jgi:hypothetical protein
LGSRKVASLTGSACIESRSSDGNKATPAYPWLLFYGHWFPKVDRHDIEQLERVRAAAPLKFPMPHDDLGTVLDADEALNAGSWPHSAPQANRALQISPKRPIRLVGRHGLEPWTR